MLHFFRSIRQNLLNENKTVKYLKYAFGEFILVVLGILVALQINNWNEGRKLEEQRRQLIENLKADFNETQSDLEARILKGENLHEAHLRILKIARGDEVKIPQNEFMELIDYAFNGVGFEPVLQSYQAAVSSGSINLIGDRELNKRFIVFEQLNSNHQIWNRLEAENAISGTGQELRKKLGSWGVLFGTENYTAPDAFALSGQAFWDLIASREFYSTFEQSEMTHRNQLNSMNDLKRIIEQILTALEAL